MSSDLHVRSVRQAAILVAMLLCAPALSRAAETPPATTPTPGQAAAAPTVMHRPTYPPVEAGPIAEDTHLDGKPDVKLTGVWFLVTNAELVPGKFKTFPQIFKITADKDGPKFQILDVLLPDDIQQAVKTANSRTLQQWQPDAAMLKELQENWSKLPPAKLKYTGDFLYAKIHYTVTLPDKYGQGADDALSKVYKDSKYTIEIQEEYRPRDLGPDSRIAQMITRATFYGVKAIDKDTVKGDMVLNFIAAGSGSPIPYKFSGPFVMYKLAP